MRYLGSLSGEGVLTSGGREVGRVEYDFDGFEVRPFGVKVGGEIMAPDGLAKDVFDAVPVQLRTDDGHLFGLQLSSATKSLTHDTAHVDAIAVPPTSLEGWPFRAGGKKAATRT
jgi:hypothetical protein